MGVSIEDIKKLRDRTGVSMTACKSSLEEANGDIEKAVELLRKKGEAKAADRAERSTGEGTIVIEKSGNKAAVVTLLCETDFVARSDDFIALAKTVAGKVLSGEVAPGTTDIEGISDAVIKLGENVQVGSTHLVEASTLGSYVHSNGKIGVVVGLDSGSEEVAKDVAMHSAATNPVCISPEEIPQESVDKEKEIWQEQLAKEGKPAEIMEKIMIGKEKKFREENALLKQPFVKNPEQTVENILGGAKIVSFVRVAI